MELLLDVPRSEYCSALRELDPQRLWLRGLCPLNSRASRRKRLFLDARPIGPMERVWPPAHRSRSDRTAAHRPALGGLHPFDPTGLTCEHGPDALRHAANR